MVNSARGDRSWEMASHRVRNKPCSPSTNVPQPLHKRFSSGPQNDKFSDVCSEEPESTYLQRITNGGSITGAGCGGKSVYIGYNKLNKSYINSYQEIKGREAKNR
jgi:hypothetical protein